MNEFTNSLINETSPYLLQHAHNPVNWFPWNDEALLKAKREKKLLLISVGYSACHWCHVMEKESFEDLQVAELMNSFFINIKIDREERPDIDSIYMDAVQLMTGHGGWPLNCVTLPDGRPIWGGTYFPKNDWIQALQQLVYFYKENLKKTEEYAHRLTQGVQKLSLIDAKDSSGKLIQKSDLNQIVLSWKDKLDYENGGLNKYPKFPMPNNYQFLLRYAHLIKDKPLLNFIDLTLKKMVWGGLYDRIGGGFARYSTDIYWKVPHFEKMLYDNAQLVSLYSEAYLAFKVPAFKKVVGETLGFIREEMTSPEGAFYSSLDADTEGIEGKYYVWSKQELKLLLSKEEFTIAEVYFNINEKGYWENEQYILFQSDENTQAAEKLNIPVLYLEEKVKNIKEKLKKARSRRVKPSLDDKVITSWNALMIKGYVDAYLVFNQDFYLKSAVKCAKFIQKNLSAKNHRLYRSYCNGKTTINGYLEDYAFAIEAFLRLYEATFEEKWIIQATEWVKYVYDHFNDNKSGLFYFTSDEDPALITRKTEVVDNVIPSSNSSLAKSLYKLSILTGNQEWKKDALQMFTNVKEDFSTYGSAYSNWGMIGLYEAFPFHEIAFVGMEALEKKRELLKKYIPNKLIAGSLKKSSNLSFLSGKFFEDKTLLYVCQNQSCKRPVENVEKALGEIL